MRFTPLLVAALLLSTVESIAQPFAGDYRSAGTGPWGVAGTWETFDGIGWVAAATPPPSDASGGFITIRSPHIVTVALSTTTDQTTVQSGGTLAVTPGQSLTVANGTGTDLTNSGVVSTTAESQLTFSPSATYDHTRDGGAIPLAQWNNGSVCNVSGITATAPANLNPSGGFYHFTWNCTAQSTTVSMEGNLRNIAGDLTILSTNGQFFRLSSTTAAPLVSIGGNFSILGTASRVTFTASGSITISVAGDFIYSSSSTGTGGNGSILKDTGTFTMSIGGDFIMNPAGSGNINVSSGSSDATFNFNKNFNLTSGTLTESGTGVVNLNFNRTGTQDYTNTGSILNSFNYNIAVGSVLNTIGESALAGAGTTTVNGTLRAGSLDTSGAIQANLTTRGNVRTTNRVYNTGARIVYSGAGPQFIANGHPTASDVITEIDNASGVTFNLACIGNTSATDLTIGGNLVLTTGNLILSGTGGGRSFTFNGNVTANSNFIVPSGGSCDFNIGGTGSFGTFPFQAGAQSIRNFSLNRTSSGSVTFSNPLTVTGTTTLTNGTMVIGATSTLTGNVSLATGSVLDFSGQSLTMGGNFTTTGGLLAATNTSTLTLTGSTALTSPLNFSPSANTLNTLVLNKSNAGTSATVSSALTVTSALTLTAGQLSITASALALSNGATISRNSAASITTSSPAGPGWNVSYTGGSLATSLELPASGSILSLTVNSNAAAVITLGQNVTITNGFSNPTANRTFTCGNNSMTTGTFSNFGTFNAPGSAATTGLTIKGASFANDGTFNDNSGTLTIDGNVAMSGATITAISFNNIIINPSRTLTPGSVLNLLGNFTINGGFVAGGGSVVFLGTVGSKTLSGTTNVNFYNITLNKSNAGISLSIGSNQTVTNSLTLTAGQLDNPAGRLTVNSGASISRNSASSISTASPSGGPWNLTYTGGSLSTSLEIPTLGSLSSLTINSNNAAVITLNQNVAITGALTNGFSNRTFTSGAFNVSAGSVANTGIFNAPTNASAQGLRLTGAPGTFVNDGTFAANSGKVTVVGNITMSGANLANTNFFDVTISGTLNAGSALNVQGNFQNDGAFVAGTGTVSFTGNVGSKTLSGTTNTQFYNLVINKGNVGVSVTVGSAQTVTNTLVLGAGQLDNPSSRLSLSSGATIQRYNFGSITTASPGGGLWNLQYLNNTMSSGLEIPSNGKLLSMTVSLTSANNLTLTRAVDITNDLVIQNGSIVTPNAFTIAATNVNIASGTLNAPSTTLTLNNSGTFTNASTFAAGTGTVVFAGSTTLAGANINSTNFNNITINNLSTLITSPTLNIQGNFQNNGTLTAGSGVVIFSGATGGKTISGTGNTQFYQLTINKSNVGISVSVNSIHTVTNTLNLTAGRLDNPSGNLRMSNGASIVKSDLGSITNTSPGGGPWSVTYINNTQATSLEIPTSGNLLSLTEDMSSGTTLTLSSNVSITNALQINAKTIGPTFTSGAHTISAGTVINGGTLNAPTGLFVLTSNGAFVNNGTVDNQSGTISVIGADFTNNGIFSGNTGTLSLTGNSNFVNNAAFNGGTNGQVIFNGVSQVQGTFPTTFRHVVVSSIGQLTAPAILSLTGDLTNNGNLVAGTNLVDFVGGTLQHLQGTTLTNYYDIRVSNSSVNPGVSIETDQNLIGTLTMMPGTHLDADGSGSGNAVFSLLSTADKPGTQDARVAIVPPDATVDGKITVHRYQGARDDDDRFLSSPVETATVQDWQLNGFFITGNFTGTSYPCTGCLNNAASLVYYKESDPGAFSQGYYATPVKNGTNAEVLVPGRGYDAWMWNGVAPTTIHSRGRINQGNVTFTVTRTNSVPAQPSADGWNLIGNPYPSAIRWAASGWNSNLIDPTVYVWDWAIDNFRTYNYSSGLGNLNGGVISSGQAFWVYAYPPAVITDPVASLSITENAKVVPGATNGYYRLAAGAGKTQTSTNAIKVSLTSNDVMDEVFLVFHPRATVDFDRGIDAWKLETGKENLQISLMDNQKRKLAHYAITPDYQQDIPLYVASKIIGTAEISFSVEGNVSEMDKLWLVDTYRGSKTALSDAPYQFEIDKENTATTENRFFITRNPDVLIAESTKVSCYPNPASGVLHIEVNDENVHDVTMYNSSGAVVSTIAMELDKGLNRGALNVASFAPGMYIVKVVTQEKVLIQKIIIR